MIRLAAILLATVALVLGACGWHWADHAQPASQDVRGGPAPQPGLPQVESSRTGTAQTIPTSAPRLQTPNALRNGIAAIGQHTLAAIGRSQGDWRQVFDAGNRALADGSLTRARQCFERACRLAPRQVEPLQALAAVLVAYQQFDTAADTYRKILDIDGSDRVTRFNLAVALSQLAEFDEAQKLYEQLLAEEPDDVRCLYNLAALLDAQGKLRQATDAWGALLKHHDKLAPRDAAAAYECLAQDQMDLQQARAAMKSYAQACKLEPGSFEIWLNYAISAHSAGELSIAAAAARNAARLSPRTAAVHLRLGDILLDIHHCSNNKLHLRDAVKAYRQCLKLSPDQPQLKARLTKYEHLLAGTSAK